MLSDIPVVPWYFIVIPFQGEPTYKLVFDK